MTNAAGSSRVTRSSPPNDSSLWWMGLKFRCGLSCSSGVIATASGAGRGLLLELQCFSSFPASVSVLTAAMSFLKSFPPPGSAEGLRQQQPETEAVLNGKGLGTGTLYIAER